MASPVWKRRRDPNWKRINGRWTHVPPMVPFDWRTMRLVMIDLLSVDYTQKDYELVK